MSKYIKSLLAALIAFSLMGCSDAYQIFAKIKDTTQDQYEKKADYLARRPTLETKLSFSEPDAERNDGSLELRWASYDVEAETLNLQVPENGYLFIAEYHPLIVSFSKRQYRYFRDYSRKGHPAITGSIPLASTKRTNKELEEMYWLIRYFPNVLRSTPIKYENDYREEITQVSYPVELISIELHNRSGLLWSAPLPPGTEPGVKRDIK